MPVHYDSKAPYTLFKRGSSWHMRFSIEGQGQVRHSLKTKDEHEAKRLAFEFYAEAKHNTKLGLKAKTKSFDEYMNMFLRQLERRTEQGVIKAEQFKRFYAILDRYAREFFRQESVAHLTSNKVTRYWDWRNAYWTDGPGKSVTHLEYERDGKQVRMPISPRSRKAPSSSTRATEAQALRAFFTWLRKEGHTKEVIEVESQKVKPNPRPGFTMEEFGKLNVISTRRALGDPDIHPRIMRDRLRLRAYIELMAFSGMRPPEAANLKWQDIHHFKPDIDGYDDEARLACGKAIRLHVHGKGKKRPIVAMPEIYWSINQLWGLCREELGRDPEPSESPFINSRGNVQTSFRNGLNALLEEADLLYDYTGAKRSAYSFRHFFATQMIIAGVPFYSLAANMGTSPEMLQSFYVDATSEHLAHQLQPQWKVLAERLGAELED
ncbi:site-specific integrase [Gluconobacter cerevisiae]|uniref:Site-specific integrase n=2 Tax=Gluconobacter TaxID=441 RepID=A0ABR9YFQ2_9PROT|nr:MULTISPECIES: site-specific integrase [Gluconobacter]MBF0877494.1 site-specific integrase [Gluconobacter cerevisiae]GBR29017.1 phage DNA recombinase [Gluconobacter kondonii NBRC 3266]GLQ66069.1 hypothetical protein GCM10007870_16530 [Gluconobacter kondonii]